MKEALQAAAATAAATAAAGTLGATMGGMAGKLVATTGASAVGVGPAGVAAASCHLPSTAAATAATATALMGVQKPQPNHLLQQHQQQHPALLQDMMLRGHGLLAPPTTASALVGRKAPHTKAPPPPPLRLRSAPGLEGFANASPQHPLDPLSIEELETAGLIAGQALAASKQPQTREPLESVRLAEVALLEPPKARLVTYQGKSLREALAWGMPRMAQCTAFSVASGKTYRVLVDLSAGVRSFVGVLGGWMVGLGLCLGVRGGGGKWGKMGLKDGLTHTHA